MKHLLAATLCVFLSAALLAEEPSRPVITNFNVSPSQRSFRFKPYPAVSKYNILSATNPAAPFIPDTNFFQAPYVINVYSKAAGVYSTNFGYEWRNTNAAARIAFYRVLLNPLSSNSLLAATVLNRLTYGPTPDEIERINAIGPDGYIAEQLAPWSFAEDVTGTSGYIPVFESKFAEATNFVYWTNATISDLRGWHLLRAIGARRQFLEILLQFLENHFVTQWSKSRAYFADYYTDGIWQDALAAQFEYLENEKWRNALVNPSCTFYDLLKISAESPAMILYLDTVSSRGDSSNIANENYARELLELFTMGVDNGYDQNDITVQSRIWTGWAIEKVALSNAFNPFAPAYTNSLFPGSVATNGDKSNFYGVWAFNYKTNFHNTSSKSIFTNKFVPARFGPPWTSNLYGTNTVPGKYQIVIPGHGATDTNGISEGYQFLTHIANLPFTEEYISIKLCRLLVHDNFPNPSNDPSNSLYSAYNYAAGNLSPEADLVRQCMLTWETNSPKGQIWKVLQTIINSALFRGHGASQQKVKTPIEFTVSAIRALRSSTNGSNLAASFTAFTDGYSLAGSSPDLALPAPLTRMGMSLFDRDAPDGYAETAPPWVSTGSLAERLRFVQSFCIAPKQSGHSDTPNSATNDASGCVSDIVGLLQAKTPSFAWTNPGAVADYFLGILFPGEGSANLALYRTLAINFLNTDETGSASPLNTLTVSSNFGMPYDTRVRGMVAMLMTMPRFQEQ
jgi:uncharacterized protein (DUF1800 family)